MKKIALLSTIALLSGGLLLGVTSCGGNEEPKPDPTPNPDEVVEDLTKFTGEATIEGTKQNVVMELDKDAKTFTFTYGEGIDATTLTGTFEYEDGFGYVFHFEGDGNAYPTTYDEATKSHVLNYVIKSGTDEKPVFTKVTLTMKDSNFKLIKLTAKEQYVRNAEFRAIVKGTRPSDNGGTKNDLLKLNFTYDGKAQIRGWFDDEKGLIHEYDKDGTYEFKNNTFSLTIEGKKYNSKFNLSTREYTIDIGEQHFKFNPTFLEKTISGRNNDFMGGFDADVFFFGDNTCKLDLTSKMKSMNDLLDQPGTYKVEENGDITINLNGGPFAKPSVMIATKQADGTFKAELKMSGQDGENITVLTGTPNKMFDLGGSKQMGPDGKVVCSTVFTSATEATFVAKGKMPLPPRPLTYTFENNVITLKDGDKTFTTTWTEETGEYKVKYSFDVSMGPEQTMPFGCDLAYQVW